VRLVMHDPDLPGLVRLLPRGLAALLGARGLGAVALGAIGSWSHWLLKALGAIGNVGAIRDQEVSQLLVVDLQIGNLNLRHWETLKPLGKKYPASVPRQDTSQPAPLGNVGALGAIGNIGAIRGQEVSQLLVVDLQVGNLNLRRNNK